MGPVRSFFHHLAFDSGLPMPEDLTAALKAIDMVLNPMQTLPTDLERAVQTIEDLQKNDDSQDNGLCTVFATIHAGKLVLKRAKEVSQSLAKDYKFLETATSDFQPVLDLIEKSSNGTSFAFEDAVNAVIDGSKAMESVIGNKSSSETVKHFMDKSKSSMLILFEQLGRSFIHTTMQWMKGASSAITASEEAEIPQIELLPESKLEGITSKPLWKKHAGTLVCAMQLSKLARSTLATCRLDTSSSSDHIKLLRNYEGFKGEFLAIMHKIDEDNSQVFSKMLESLAAKCFVNVRKDSQEELRKLADAFCQAWRVKKFGTTTTNYLNMVQGSMTKNYN